MSSNKATELIYIYWPGASYCRVVFLLWLHKVCPDSEHKEGFEFKGKILFIALLGISLDKGKTSEFS